MSFGDPYTPQEETINRIFDRFNQKIRSIIMTAADDAVNAAADQADKARGEVTAQVSELQAVIDELNEQSVKPATLDRLKAATQALDDLNPDQPA